MTVGIYVKKEDLEKLQAFIHLEEASVDICWADRPHPECILVMLQYDNYLRLVNISTKLEVVSEEPVELSEEVVVDFWDLNKEDLEIFNKKGLFSLDQLQAAFFAGEHSGHNTLLESRGEVFEPIVNFSKWYFTKITLDVNNTESTD